MPWRTGGLPTPKASTPGCRPKEQSAGRHLEAQGNRLYTAISHTAEERYQESVQAFPDFYQRIPLHMIASYLGVSRETLSRIRKQH
ncbi:cyclic nucleotide-binding domain-containing protein [Hymenobacter guriensis]|uniref:Crp/Fnr family transcriptional regulator n=1 Tax=Hymenobacter guriensis TaxID=2793065 RepID=A0ABS0L1W6_9BACT|nr:hypothetical protein [Hymenobacter guriensis]MBG8554111.1 hypothetical protein [Hymenobacter guriensis]